VVSGCSVHTAPMLDSPRDTNSPGRRVLVVDDDPKFVDIVVRCLERAGYDCVTGESGDHALWAVLDHRPDVIVLDVMMPHPSGIEVCRHLRADGWTGGIVIVSARNSDSDRTAAQRAGADVVLAKPFPLDELLAAVETLVRPVA
jgi:two-component system, OmpR family, response regulator